MLYFFDFTLKFENFAQNDLEDRLYVDGLCCGTENEGCIHGLGECASLWFSKVSNIASKHKRYLSQDSVSTLELKFE